MSLIITVSFITDVFSIEISNKEVLIISSYNPETGNMAKNIDELMNECSQLSNILKFNIENMNCRNFPEAIYWKLTMKDILDKYIDRKRPDMIILLGQEAWSSYLSQDDENLFSIPVVIGMASSHAIFINDEIPNLSEWQPKSIDLTKDFLFDDKFKFIGGFLYEYDIKKNIDLILNLFPETRNIALITDNTYGGVALQAHVRQQMRDYNRLNFIPLDGRRHTIYSLTNELSHLPKKSVILLGTWRVDSNESYFMQNATYTMKEANPDIPVFTLSSLGIGHWAVGGYIPQYRTIGKDLAHLIINYFENPEEKVQIEMVENNYIFDYKKLETIDGAFDKLPPNVRFENKDETFWEKFGFIIIIVASIFAILLIAFLISLYYFINTKRLNVDIENSRKELMIAKDKAEESNRLKTVFLATMSHEIRTPLNAIIGFSNALISENNNRDEISSYKELIQTNAELLLELINNVLDVARLEADRVKFYIIDCDIVSLCRSAISSVSYSKKTAAELIFDPPMGYYNIQTDSNRLRGIIMNLLTNAIKFTPAGFIILNFKIENDNNRILFSVTDTGCGIPIEKHDVIFNSFIKLNQHQQGTGLGLPICKLTINKLGGDIWIDTNHTDGTKVVFSHPLNIDKVMFANPV